MTTLCHSEVATRPKNLLLFLALASMIALPGGLIAQTGRIVGTVVDTTGVPLADAEIVANGNARTRSDSAGAFQLSGLSPGKVSLRVRRLGYIVEDRDVQVRSDQVTTVRFALVRRALLLDTIAVTADCERFKLSGFVCRRRSGKGVYFDANVIDSINPRFPVDVFRDQYGFRVDASPTGLIVVATRGWKCLTALANGRPPSLANPLPRWPREMLAVEFYARADDVPKEYEHYSWRGAKRCSLIVYWTQLPPRNGP